MDEQQFREEREFERRMYGPGLFPREYDPLILFVRMMAQSVAWTSGIKRSPDGREYMRVGDVPGQPGFQITQLDGDTFEIKYLPVANL